MEKNKERRPRRLWRRLLKIFLFLISILIIVILGVGIWIHTRVSSSLPVLEGEWTLQGLSEPVTILRDANGVPTVQGKNRLDVARALGFLHAQERFFQMDLMRRRAAGELAELFGRMALEWDRRARVHQFRKRSKQNLMSINPSFKTILDGYVEGVNAGLTALDEVPFEYLLLGVEPRPWRGEDSFLMMYSMFFALADERNSRESAYGVLYDVLPPDMVAFLAPPGTEWDAPLTGDPFSVPPIPGPEVMDLRKQKSGKVQTNVFLMNPPEERLLGSNNWAVAGWRTAHGGALLANDMHLGLSVPNIWYRAVLEWSESGSRDAPHRVMGIILPGTPVVIVGSNSDIAWGFTNTQCDFMDLVVVETDPNDPEQYLTPDGLRPFEKDREIILIKDAEPETLEVISTIWGPIIDNDHRGRRRALRWIAHDTESVNLNVVRLEKASSVTEALDIAAQCGIPPQNMVCADRDGHIGWTIMGRIPRRIGFNGQTPESWADGTCRWDGWLEKEEYPRILDPPSGFLWTANARTVDGEMLARLGDGGYVLGARAWQIRDNLQALENVSEADMLAVPLHNRAGLRERWRSGIMRILTPEVIAGNARRAEFRRLVEESWTGRASIDSVGYRLVRAYRYSLFETVYGWLTADCLDTDDRFRFRRISQWETPLWKLVTECPIHLLDARFDTWKDALVHVVDETCNEFASRGLELSECTWGERNMSSIRHPMSRAVPLLSGLLDMPARALPGDSSLPRAQSPSYGASERLVVSPGRETEGIFHMPGGQSGHPLSPYYGAGHEDWENGRPTSFLPGPTKWILELKPPPK